MGDCYDTVEQVLKDYVSKDDLRKLVEGWEKDYTSEMFSSRRITVADCIREAKELMRGNVAMKVEYKLIMTVEYSGEADICQEDYALAKSLPVEDLSDWIEKRLDMNEYQGVVYNGASLTPRGGGDETL